MATQSKEIISSYKKILIPLSFPLWYEQYDENYPLKQELGGCLALNGTDLACQFLTQSSSKKTQLIARLTLPIIVGFGTYYCAANIDNKAVTTLAKNYSVQAIVHIIQALTDYQINKSEANKAQAQQIMQATTKFDLSNVKHWVNNNPLLLFATMIKLSSFLLFFFAFPRPDRLPRTAHFIYATARIPLSFICVLPISALMRQFSLLEKNPVANKVCQIAYRALTFYGAFFVTSYIANIPGISHLLRNDLPIRLSWQVLAFEAIRHS